MNEYNIHKDFKKYENLKFNLNPLLLPLMNVLIAFGASRIKPLDGLSVTKKKIRGYQDGMIGLTVYEPKDTENTPCLIYLHGGAFAFKAAPYHISLAQEYALKTPCKVIVVDYRLLPKYAFPFAIEDCFAAFKWVSENTESLGIDKNRIAIGGDSAGGTITAAVTQMVRDRNAGDICFQMLIYPLTDARMITDSVRNYIDTPVVNSQIVEKTLNLYLENGIHNKSPYASPIEIESFENLPNAYIEVAEFDPLHDEGLEYAEALRKSGGEVELNVAEGTIHGFDQALESEVVRLCVQRRIAALQKAFDLEVRN